LYSLIKSRIKSALLFAAALGMSVISANAEATKPLLQIDTVSTFNEICYTKLPYVKGIEAMATDLVWKPVDEAELSAFGNKDQLTYLRGWDVNVGKKYYRLGLTQGPASDAIKNSFPDFVNGVASSCTMVLDGSDAKTEIAKNMQTLAGKEPIRSNVDEGELLSTTWAGGNNDFKVVLINKQSKTDDGGLISVTVISKN